MTDLSKLFNEWYAISDDDTLEILAYIKGKKNAGNYRGCILNGKYSVSETKNIEKLNFTLSLNNNEIGKFKSEDDAIRFNVEFLKGAANWFRS